MKFKKCIVYLFLCLSKCHLRSLIIRKLAFFPPYPPTYTLRKKEKQSFSVSHIILNSIVRINNCPFNKRER